MLLLTFNTGASSKLENAAVQMALERGVEGIIFAAMYHRSVRVPKDAFRLPLVLVDCFAPKSPVPSVVPDEFQGGYLATKLLLEKGHRRIAMINAGRKYPAAVGPGIILPRLRTGPHTSRICLTPYDLLVDGLFLRPRAWRRPRHFQCLGYISCYR